MITALNKQSRKLPRGLFPAKEGTRGDGILVITPVLAQPSWVYPHLPLICPQAGGARRTCYSRSSVTSQAPLGFIQATCKGMGCLTTCVMLIIVLMLVIGTSSLVGVTQAPNSESPLPVNGVPPSPSCIIKAVRMVSCRKTLTPYFPPTLFCFSSLPPPPLPPYPSNHCKNAHLTFFGSASYCFPVA